MDLTSIKSEFTRASQKLSHIKSNASLDAEHYQESIAQLDRKLIGALRDMQKVDVKIECDELIDAFKLGIETIVSGDIDSDKVQEVSDIAGNIVGLYHDEVNSASWPSFDEAWSPGGPL